MPGRIYVGTSSWVDKALIESGRFYPEEADDTPSRLAYYAQHFDLAEVDSTYYALPSSKNIERWASSVPDGFKFNVKVFGLFSQHPTRISSIPKSFRDDLPEPVAKKARVYYKDIPDEVRDELWTIYRRALRPMRDSGKLGAVLIDFPPWFVPSKENRDYLEHAKERLPDEDVLIEFRNRLWVDDDRSAAETFDLLRELQFGFCCVDEPRDLKSSFPPVVAVTAPVAAVRFRGRNAEHWEDKKASMADKLNWSYSEEELAEWLPRIEELAAGAGQVFLTINTKVDDQSVVNAALLQQVLGLRQG